MSLIYTVVGLIEQAGRATRDDLLPHCPGFTAEQVSRALGNAKQDGLIHQVGTVGTRRMAIWEHGPAPQKPQAFKRHGRPVSCVWELGAL